MSQNPVKTKKNKPVATQAGSVDDFVIAGTSIARGRKEILEIPIALLPSQTKMSMPTVVIRGKQDGPVLWISSAIHGDEINGVEIISRLLEYVTPKNIRGTLIAVPIVNVFGFTHQSRYLPDRRDLNRSFPGSKTGSLAARLAHLFMNEVVAKATHGIDLHTGAIHRCNLIHTRCDPGNETNLALAMAFGAPVVLVNKSGKGTLRAAANKKDIPNILVELGEALRFDEPFIEECNQGILRVMNLIGMLENEVSCSLSQPVVVKETVWVRARHGGLFHADVDLGDRVEKGQKIGKIHDVLGQNRGTLVSPKPGIVICIAKNPLVYQGDALIHIAAANPDGQG
jgi:hypothetical protein